MEKIGHFLLDHVCIQSSKYVQIFKSLKRGAKIWNEIDFLSVIFHKWVSSKNNLILQIFYLLRERPRTYNEFCVLCIYYTNNTFQKQSLETYLQIDFLSV